MTNRKFVNGLGIGAAVVAAGAVIGVTQLTGDPAAWKGSFDTSYAAAAPGATIEVPAGNIVLDWPSEGAVKIRPAAKASADPITFVCKGDGDVIFPEGQLVITARNVVMRGACFKMKKLWVGDPANGVSTANVTIDGVVMQTFDISGSDDVTIRNSDVGPSVASDTDQNYVEPKVHSGGAGGGVSGARVLLDNVTIHDIQTRDSVKYHTGGLWVGYGSAGSLTIRNSRFIRNAIYDIHVDRPFGGPSPNLTLDGNTFQYPVEPFSNFNGGAETTPGFTELQVKCVVNQPLTNWKITNNSWQHGWDLKFGGCSGTTYPGLTITGNTGGTTRNPAETASVPPPPPPPTTTEPPPTTTTPPPPACAAPTLGWKLPTRATITITWPSVPNASGYRLYKNGAPVSTAAASAMSAKFGSLPYGDTLLGVAAVCSSGEKISTLTTFETRTAR